MTRILACLALVFSVALPTAGQGMANVTVSGDSVSAKVSLPGGFGADLTLRFEEVTGLSLANLGISAQVVNPLDPTLLARLPGGTIPAAFPVLLRIEPPAAGGLSFTGIATLEIHTENLQYIAGSPLRLFKAPLGGPFEDVTVSMGAGSYRARGTSGGFSEFLLVADTRSVDRVITTKFAELEDELDEYSGSMPTPLYQDLATRLAVARADYARGAIREAVQEVDGFLAVVEQHSGTDIPDVWRSARDLENAAGYLRAAAMTLRFSLALKGGLGF